MIALRAGLFITVLGALIATVAPALAQSDAAGVETTDVKLNIDAGGLGIVTGEDGHTADGKTTFSAGPLDGLSESSEAASPTHGLSDVIEFDAVREKRVGSTINAETTSPHSGIGLEYTGVDTEYALQTRLLMMRDFQPGIEAHALLPAIDRDGIKVHRVGPVAQGKISLGGALTIGYEFGWLFPITSDTPSPGEMSDGTSDEMSDDIIKARITYGIRF